MIEVALIEDDEDIREGLQLLLDDTDSYDCVGSFASCEDALQELGVNILPDVLLLDINLPGMSGVAGSRLIRCKLPECQILMLTNYADDDLIFESLCNGAGGYLLKTTTPGRLLAAIKEVWEGGAPMTAAIAKRVIQSFQRPTETQLTPRELEILSHLCQGKSYKMIAAALFISTGTVHSHIKKIYRKLEVNSKSEAVAKALQQRIV